MLMLCLAYIVSGYVGRDAWKSADMTALGYMLELANGSANWLQPTLLGIPLEEPSLIPYWIGALAIQMAHPWLDADVAIRFPFAAFLALSFLAAWHAAYYLACSPKAQPVSFAFGGEAQPIDYARAIADGAVLALMACLGLAQLSHETTAALAQLAFSSLLFFAVSALSRRHWLAYVALVLGLNGLALSGAPALATLFGFGSAWTLWLEYRSATNPKLDPFTTHPTWLVALVLTLTLEAGILAGCLDLWRWKLEFVDPYVFNWNGFTQLLVWFTWPTWPIALVALWQWRLHLMNHELSLHLTLPIWFVLTTVAATLLTENSDRTLLLSLPAMATLAAFALPTLKRQLAALIDWFTLLFFSGCGLTIWVIWIAMQTGFPKDPAANVARLAPGFNIHFSMLPLSVALAATLAWTWLVHWRVGHHRTAIWKSLVLPAGGAALCWLLLMTLWMPLLNYTQSYVPIVQRTVRQIGADNCAVALGLSVGSIAALQVYGKLKLYTRDNPDCRWLLTEPNDHEPTLSGMHPAEWNLVDHVTHLGSGAESLLLYKRN